MVVETVLKGLQPASDVRRALSRLRCLLPAGLADCAGQVSALRYVGRRSIRLTAVRYFRAGAKHGFLRPFGPPPDE